MSLGKLRVFLHTLFLENEKETQPKKYRVMCFYALLCHFCVYIGHSKVSNTAPNVTEVRNKHHLFKKNGFHWLFTGVVYQQIENSEKPNQIHRFTIDHCKFILICDR